MLLSNRYCSCYREQIFKQKNCKDFQNVYSLFFTNPAATVLNSVARDCPGQQHDVKGRRELWRAGRTKTITKPLLKERQLHGSGAVVLPADLKFIIDLAFHTAGAETKPPMIINACFCSTCFHFQKGDFFCPPSPPKILHIKRTSTSQKVTHRSECVFTI